MTDPQQRPCAIAIVGRPNVGKSSIFNRLCGTRVAIVHPERGVTRDRLVQEIRWNERRLELIDTGGLLELEAPTDPAQLSNESLVTLVRQQIEIAVQDASAIIFVTDVETGILPQDQEVADFLRKSGKGVFIAANKADNPERELQAADFAALGFPVFPVSAAHNRGLKTLMEAILPTLPAPMNIGARDAPLRVAIVGRPNVGKSSFINRLLRSERVIVTPQPGTTRDSVEIPFIIGQDNAARHYLLIDTAGIRRTSKISQTLERFSLNRALHSIERADIVALVLDATQGPTAQDKAIAGLIQNYSKGCLLLIAKIDLLGKFSEKQYRVALGKALPFLSFAPVVFISSKTGFNIQHSVATIDQVAAQISRPLSTGQLNRAINQAYTRVAPPAVKGKRLKIFYATQIGKKPIKILLMVNDATKLSSAYETYLVNALRKTFGLEGAPVLFQLKPRQGKKKRN